MGRGHFNSGLPIMIASAVALSGCGVKAGPDDQETTRKTNHVVVGNPAAPPPKPTTTPIPDPPVQPEDACLSLNPRDSLDFGRVAVGEAVELSVVVTNTCDYDVTIMSARLGSLPSAAFMLADRSGVSILVPSARGRSIPLRFEPTEEGRAEGTLLISTSSAQIGDGAIMLTIRGEGSAP